ncbi:MAG: FadR/GntR family transcriptional regulator [Hoeflea sp.]|nr:FadR/GntR family transcriptional regulator [Hoeflea sp.]
MIKSKAPEKMQSFQYIVETPVQRSTFSRRSMHGQLATLLGGKIASGALPEGVILPQEAQMLADLGVSRSVLREALLVLTAKGMLESRQRLGTRVRPREDWNILDPDVIEWIMENATDDEILKLFEVRVVLEPAVASIAATAADPEDVKRIESALLDMEDTVESLVDFIPPDLRFHQEIHNASKNQFLIALGKLVSDAVLTLMIVVQVNEQIRRRNLLLHRRVFEHIRDHNPQEAALAMSELLEAARLNLQAALEARSR